MLESKAMKVEIIRSHTHNLSQIAKEMRGQKWRELGHNYDTKRIRRFVEDENNYFLLAYEEGAVAGMLIAYMQEKMDNKRKREVFLDELETKPKFKRKGIAKGLMSKLFQIAKSKKASEVWVLTQTNNRPAKALYSKVKKPKHKGEISFFSYSI